jgi:hypothetical protein
VAHRKNKSRWTGAYFSEAWENGLALRLRRWVLEVPGWPSRQRPKLEFGSTDGVLAAVDGSTDGVVVGAGGSIDGVVVLGEVGGSIGGE